MNLLCVFAPLRRINSCYLSFFTLLLLVSCSSAKPQHEENSRLRINMRYEPLTPDPRLGSDALTSSLHALLFEGLMRPSPDGIVKPGLAESFTLSSDLKTYTFHLRKALWSDGTPITAFDFERSWKEILAPDFPAANAPLLYCLKNGEAVKKGEAPLECLGIHAKDEKTLVIELTKPTPYFLDLVSFSSFAPVKKGKTAYSGPFLLEKWEHGREIVCQKNPLYWDEDYSALSEITISFIGDEHTALTLFEQRELDVLGGGISPIPRDALKEYHAKGVLHTQEAAATTLVSFNLNDPLFQNKNIRKAFTLATPKDDITTHITYLGEVSAVRALPPALIPTSIQKSAPSPSPKDLLALGLRELGLERLPEITYHYTASETNHQLAQVLQRAWHEKLGALLKLQSLDYKTLMEKLYRREYQMAQTCYIAQYPDPMSILERFKSKDNPKNYPGWENAAYAKLLDEADLETTHSLRIKKCLEAEDVLLEEAPFIPIYHWKRALLLQEGVSYNSEAGGAFLLALLHKEETR